MFVVMIKKMIMINYYDGKRKKMKTRKCATILLKIKGTATMTLDITMHRGQCSNEYLLISSPYS